MSHWIDARKIRAPLKGFAEDVIFDNLSKTSHIFFKSRGRLKLYFCHICGTGKPDLSKVIVGTFGATTMHRRSIS
jgi:hypothetical protein